MSTDKCKICEGEGWVCEDHANKAWKDGDGCCGGAGMQFICTIGGYFGYMKDLYAKAYKKLGIPPRIE